MKKEYLKNIILRGIIAMGFGPIVLSIVYGVLDLVGAVSEIAVSEMVMGVVSITLLAFLAGGLTYVYQIEELGLGVAICIHGLALYIGYAIMYVANGWLANGAVPFIVFTVVFVLGFALTWLVIYFVTKSITKKLNKGLAS